MHRKYVVRIITHRGIVAGHFRTYARTPTWPCADSCLRANAPSAERSARRVACGGDPAPSVSTRPRHRNPGLRAPFRVPFAGPEGTSSASVLVTSKAPAPGLRPGSSVLSEHGLKAAHAHARPGKAGSCSSTPRRARAGGTAAWLRREPEVLAEVPGPRPRLGDSPPRPPRWAPGAAPGRQGARLGSAPQPRGGADSPLRPSGVRLWEPRPGRPHASPRGARNATFSPETHSRPSAPPLSPRSFPAASGRSKASMQSAAEGDSAPQHPQSGCPWKLGLKHKPHSSNMNRQTRTKCRAVPGAVRGAEDAPGHTAVRPPPPPN